MPLAGSRYDALAVDDLDAVNLFALAAAGADPALLTLAVVGTGTESRPGFVVLRSQADPAAGVLPAAELLQDHTRCPAPLPPGPSPPNDPARETTHGCRHKVNAAAARPVRAPCNEPVWRPWPSARSATATALISG